MKARLEALSKAIGNPDLHSAILQSLIRTIEDDKQLHEALTTLLPFLSDGDRNIRIQAIAVLAMYNSQFRSPVIQKSISEMAVIKLSDSACTATCCDVIESNLKKADKTTVETIFGAVLAVDLRTCIVDTRTKAYKLLGTVVEQGVTITDGAAVLTALKSFCGYEQDPRGLAVVFHVVPPLMRLILPTLTQSGDKHDLFDIMGAFYPIIGNNELNQRNAEALAAIPEFADELATVVTLKLKNSMADTRPAMYQTLDKMLVNKTSNSHIVPLVTAFMQSLKVNFEEDSSSCDEKTVHNGVMAVTEFVRKNDQCWKLMNAVAVNEWIPEILQCKDTNVIRAYSIVIWNIDGYLQFAKEAMKPLAEAAKKAAGEDDVRLQSVLASVVEFLKLQEVGFNEERPETNPFLAIAVDAIAYENQNLQITCLVLIRELATKSHLPVVDGVVSAVVSRVREIPSFASQALLALAMQAQYFEPVGTEFTGPFCTCLLDGTDSELFGSPAEAIGFALEVSKSPLFASIISVCFARKRMFGPLLKTICEMDVIGGEEGAELLEALGSADGEIPNEVLLAVGLRLPDSVMSQILMTKTSVRTSFLAAASPAAVPKTLFDVELSEDERMFISAKFREFPPGFKVHTLACALRGEFTDDFEPALIPKLSRLENMFDSALGSLDKSEVLHTRFIYSDFKQALWAKWRGRLDNDPENLLQLCLLCPPEFYEQEMNEMIKHFPVFMKCNIGGAVDLLIFSLFNVNGMRVMELIKTLNAIVEGLVTGLNNPSARIRLDICRVLRLLPAQIPGAACGVHKSRINRALRDVLDDPKREVRVAAGEARCAWVRVDVNASI